MIIPLQLGVLQQPACEYTAHARDSQKFFWRAAPGRSQPQFGIDISFRFGYTIFRSGESPIPAEWGFVPCTAKPQGLRMKNFIIFNTEKEGSCALITTLDQFEQVTVISDFIEPFDRHMFVNHPNGPGHDIAREDFIKCLELIYGTSEGDLEQLNAIYGRYRSDCRFDFAKGTSLGFKMRFRRKWKKDIFSLLKRYGVTAFVLIRQDVLRWALSKYHGDGTGKKGHLQFSTVNIKELPKMEVQWKLLKKQIERCEKRIADRQRLLQDLRNSGIAAHPLFYEDFCDDKTAYFKRLFETLDIAISEGDIEATLRRGSLYKKVHPEELSEFISNHEEILGKYEAYRSRHTTGRGRTGLNIFKLLHR
jgi:hypothetical protein